MERGKIRENLYREDKMMCAVKFETTENYINQILCGFRNDKSKKAQAIIADLENRAQINIQFKTKKQEI